jgi:hypothetical protein
MKAIRRAIAPALTLIVAGCYFGQTAARFEPALGPRGVSTTITTQVGKSVTGELLEVGDEGLRVDTAEGVALVPYAILRDGAFAQTGIRIQGGHAPGASTREKLRLLSRFPQGLSPALLKTLLEAHGQTEVTRVAR